MGLTLPCPGRLAGAALSNHQDGSGLPGFDHATLGAALLAAALVLHTLAGSTHVCRTPMGFNAGLALLPGPSAPVFVDAWYAR